MEQNERFPGFAPEAVDFLWQLRFNNDRSWFEPRKEQFRELIDLPMRRLGGLVQEEIDRRWPKVPLDLRVARIYRDARRLHGKGPYKDELWFTLAPPGGGAAPGFYFGLSPESYSMGMGYYAASPLTMAKLRARIDRDPAPVEKLSRRLARRKEFVLEGEPYRRPKGDKGPLLDPWYNRRSISINWDRPCGGSLFTPRLYDEVVEGIDFLMPFYRYIVTLDGDPAPAEM